MPACSSTQAIRAHSPTALIWVKYLILSRASGHKERNEEWCWVILQDNNLPAEHDEQLAQSVLQTTQQWFGLTLNTKDRRISVPKIIPSRTRGVVRTNSENYSGSPGMSRQTGPEMRIFNWYRLVNKYMLQPGLMKMRRTFIDKTYLSSDVASIIFIYFLNSAHPSLKYAI
jgi:hypothetical protein